MSGISSIMSIREMIDAAFGDPSLNVVNHKLIHTILIILARQLRLLERRVEVQIGPNNDFRPETSVSITEIKLQANKKRKSKHISKEASKPKIDAHGSTGKNRLSTGETFVDKSSPVKAITDKSAKKLPSLSTLPSEMSYRSRLREIEEKREKQIRIIHQRADSREEHTKTPTPMASLSSIDKQYEKLLIVGRVPTDEMKSTERIHQVGAHTKVQRLSIVTHEEFDDLAKSVQVIQERFGVLGSANLSSKTRLLNDLREGASLTNAISVLQLSGRIEAVEKTLERILSLLTDLASNTPRVSKRLALKDDNDMSKNAKVIFEAKANKTEDPEISILPRVDNIIINSDQNLVPKSKKTLDKVTEEANQDNSDWITAHELECAMHDIQEEILKMVNDTTVHSNNYANNALTIASKLEKKLDQSLNLGDRMLELERVIFEYADKVNALDTGLSMQMTTYQEQLTQMQHDLESSIETMQEALANAGGDTTAITELNNQFSNLQMDLDVAYIRQKELKEMQDTLTNEIKSLRKMIEILRESKSDRDEVADALKDKAGLASLNGLVSRLEFDAVREDFYKRIGAAYDKFNNQEIVWQKAIDDLLWSLNEKADWAQVASLQESIKKYLEKFQNRINGLLEIVGEPHAAAISRKLYRETACLSCSSPAHINLEFQEIRQLPAFSSSRPPVEGSEAKSHPTEEIIPKQLCHPGLPIPHHDEDRSHVCRRYCGGSYTVLKEKLTRVPPGIIITPVKQTNTIIGQDGKTYMVDGPTVTHPCIPCNVSLDEPLPHVAESVSQISDMKSSDTIPSDYCQFSLQKNVTQEHSEVSLTPPPPIDDDEVLIS